MKNEQVVNKKVLLVIAMLGNFINPLMGSAVNVALPNIGAEFSLSGVMLSWISMSYLLASAVFLVPLGKIADISGRKKVFLIGNIVFALSSILCSLADSGSFLILSRFFQGIGGAMIFATAMAIVISAFPASERGKVIGLSVAAVYTGLSVAPILGGVITEAFGWRALFAINALVSIVISILIITKIKAEWKEDEEGKFDWLGTIIYMPSMTALMYGFSKLPNTQAVLLTIFGLIGMVSFVFIEKRQINPVLNMKLFLESRAFAGANLSAFINYAATFAVTFVMSLYLQYAKGLSPKEAGLILITQPILMSIMSILSGRLSDRINPRKLASIGMAIGTLGLIMFSFISIEFSIEYILIALALLGIGFGLFSSPNTNVVMSSVEKKYYGVAAATVSTMRTTGMMFSMAIASLAIHLFIGNQKISIETINGFIGSSQLIFIIFSVLCLCGVFLSLVGKKSQ